jgi:small subunit ribosomal protein S21
MLIVKLNKKTSIEKALKQLKSKVIKTKQMRELRERKQFTKPSQKRRLQMQKAKYVQQLKTREDQQR